MDSIGYQEAIRDLAKAQAKVLLSYGQQAPSKLEEWIAEYLEKLPAHHIVDTSRDHDLVKRHVHNSEPTATGMYLKLIHGRTTIDEVLSDWGPDGPWIGPLKWFHCTYMADIGIGFVDGEELVPTGPTEYPPAPIYLGHNMIYYDGMYYGDWELQYV